MRRRCKPSTKSADRRTTKPRGERAARQLSPDAQCTATEGQGHVLPRDEEGQTHLLDPGRRFIEGRTAPLSRAGAAWCACPEGRPRPHVPLAHALRRGHHPRAGAPHPAPPPGALSLTSRGAAARLLPPRRALRRRHGRHLRRFAHVPRATSCRRVLSVHAGTVARGRGRNGRGRGRRTDGGVCAHLPAQAAGAHAAG